jgi:N-methylhydantoinase A
VHLHGAEATDAPVFERQDLALGQLVEGPAIVEEWSSTILVPPGWMAATDRMGNLVMERAG